MEENNIISKLEVPVRKSCDIDNTLFEKWDVKRGLRNADGTGVLVGLTNIGDVVGYRKEEGKVIPIPGKLFYRGIDLEDITAGFQSEGRHGFDEITTNTERPADIRIVCRAFCRKDLV